VFATVPRGAPAGLRIEAAPAGALNSPNMDVLGEVAERLVRVTSA